MAFVVKYQLGHRLPAKNTGLARDTIYGFFTLVFLVLLAFDGKSNRADLPPHLRPWFANMKAACRAYIVEQLRTRARDTEKPPPFADFIRDLRRYPQRPFSDSVRNERARLDAHSLRVLDEKYRDYVTELDTRYGELECTRVPREV
jgi:hypothetical protein